MTGELTVEIRTTVINVGDSGVEGEEDENNKLAASQCVSQCRHQMQLTSSVNYVFMS